MDTGGLDKVGSNGDIGQNANEVVGGKKVIDEKENDVGEDEKEVEVVPVTDDEDNYAEKENVEDVIKSVTEEKSEVIEDDKEDEENKEEKEDVDDEEHEQNGEDGEGRSEETTEGEINATAVEAKERPEKKRREEDEGNVSGETEEKGREDSLGGGVVIEQTITVHADGDAVDEVLEGRHDGEAEVIDSVDEEVEGGEGVDKMDKGVQEVRREETDESGTVSTDVSISGRREEGSWRQNSTESNIEEEEEEVEEELLDRISLILFSPTSSPITIAVLAVLFITSVLGLACIYCRGRRR